MTDLEKIVDGLTSANATVFGVIITFMIRAGITTTEEFASKLEEIAAPLPDTIHKATILGIADGLRGPATPKWSVIEGGKSPLDGE